MPTRVKTAFGTGCHARQRRGLPAVEARAMTLRPWLMISVKGQNLLHLSIARYGEWRKMISMSAQEFPTK